MSQLLLLSSPEDNGGVSYTYESDSHHSLVEKLQNYYSRLLQELPACNGDLQVKIIPGLAGKGLYTNSAFTRGDLIFSEDNFHGNTDASKFVIPCEHSMRCLGTLEQQVGRLSRVLFKSGKIGTPQAVEVPFKLESSLLVPLLDAYKYLMQRRVDQGLADTPLTEAEESAMVERMLALATLSTSDVGEAVNSAPACLDVKDIEWVTRGSATVLGGEPGPQVLDVPMVTSPGDPTTPYSSEGTRKAAYSAYQALLDKSLSLDEIFAYLEIPNGQPEASSSSTTTSTSTTTRSNEINVFTEFEEHDSAASIVPTELTDDIHSRLLEDEDDENEYGHSIPTKNVSKSLQSNDVHLAQLLADRITALEELKLFSSCTNATLWMAAKAIAGTLTRYAKLCHVRVVEGGGSKLNAEANAEALREAIWPLLLFSQAPWWRQLVAPAGEDEAQFRRSLFNMTARTATNLVAVMEPFIVAVEESFVKVTGEWELAEPLKWRTYKEAAGAHIPVSVPLADSSSVQVFVNDLSARLGIMDTVRSARDLLCPFFIGLIMSVFEMNNIGTVATSPVLSYMQSAFGLLCGDDKEDEQEEHETLLALLKLVSSSTAIVPNALVNRLYATPVGNGSSPQETKSINAPEDNDVHEKKDQISLQKLWSSLIERDYARTHAALISKHEVTTSSHSSDAESPAATLVDARADYHLTSLSSFRSSLARRRAVLEAVLSPNRVKNLLKRAPEYPTGAGLYVIGCCMNHSCDPNVVVLKPDNCRSHRTAFYALKDIAPGDELCISYVENEDTRSAKSRREELKNYLFICRCSKCCKDDSKKKKAVASSK